MPRSWLQRWGFWAVLGLIHPSVFPNRKLSCQLVTVSFTSKALREAIQAGHNSEHCLFLFPKGLLFLETAEISNLESLRCKGQAVFHSDKTAREWSPTGTKWFLSAVIVTDAFWEWLSTCPHMVSSWPINYILIFVGHNWLFPESFSFPTLVFSVTSYLYQAESCLSSVLSSGQPRNPSPSLSCKVGPAGLRFSSCC